MSVPPDKVKLVDPKKVVRKAARNSRYVVNDVGEDGITPLEVMLENMRYWHAKAQRHEATLIEILALFPDKGVLKKFPKLLRVLEQFNAARAEAQRCAVDAAPFMHPKLSAIKRDDTPDDGERSVEFTMEFSFGNNGPTATVGFNGADKPNGKANGRGKVLDATLLDDDDAGDE
jgi:hypothetical protein